MVPLKGEVSPFSGVTHLGLKKPVYRRVLISGVLISGVGVPLYIPREDSVCVYVGGVLLASVQCQVSVT